MNSCHSRVLLTVDADYDAQTPARILGLITLQNVIPEWFSFRPSGILGLRIIMELQDNENESSVQLAKRIANIPTVIGVTRDVITSRAEIFT